MVQINANFSEDTPVNYNVSGLPEINTDIWRVDDIQSSTHPSIHVQKVDDTTFSIMCTDKKDININLGVNINFYNMPINKSNKLLLFEWHGTYVTPIYPEKIKLVGNRRISNRDVIYSVHFENETEITYPIKCEWSIIKNFSPEGSIAQANIVSQDDKSFTVRYSDIDSNIDEKTSWKIHIKILSKYNESREALFDENYNIYTDIEQPVITNVTNPEVMRICYKWGWCYDENKMYKNECAAVTNKQLESAIKSNGDSEFSHNPNLTHFQEFKYFTSITETPPRLFVDDDNLTKLEFPQSLEKINEQVCYGCDILGDLTIPYRVSYIGNTAFATAGVNYINILNEDENGVVGPDLTIEYNAFNGLNYLVADNSYLNIPSRCISIGTRCFENCNIEHIIIGGIQNDVLKESLFYECKSKKITINSDNINILPNSCFIRCTEMSTLNINSIEKITSIGENCFYGNYKLENFTFSKELRNIGYRAFYECYSLEDIDLSDCTNLTTLNGEVFAVANAWNGSETSISLPRTIKNIGSGALADSFITIIYCYAEEAPDLSSNIFKSDNSHIIGLKYIDKTKKLYVPGTSSPTSYDGWIDELNKVGSGTWISDRTL